MKRTPSEDRKTLKGGKKSKKISTATFLPLHSRLLPLFRGNNGDNTAEPNALVLHAGLLLRAQGVLDL